MSQSSSSGSCVVWVLGFRTSRLARRTGCQVVFIALLFVVWLAEVIAVGALFIARGDILKFIEEVRSTSLHCIYRG